MRCVRDIKFPLSWRPAMREAPGPMALPRVAGPALRAGVRTTREDPDAGEPYVVPLHALTGVPVAGVQKTTIHTFTVEGEEKTEGLHPHIRWTKTLDFVHVYRGISPMNRVFFLTSAVCLVSPTPARRVVQRG